MMHAFASRARGGSRAASAHAWAWAMTVALAAGGTVLAQARPDDTRVLDANLSTTSRYNQPRTGFLLNRINDAIVTGTAPGGKSFRGDVGYRSTFEFRGSVSGRGLYDFQRDSYFSNLAAQRHAPRNAGVLGPYQIQRPGAAPTAALGRGLVTPLSGANLQQIARERYGTGLMDLEAETSLARIRPSAATLPDQTLPIPSMLERDLRPAATPIVPSSDPLLDRSLLYGSTRGQAPGVLAPGPGGAAPRGTGPGGIALPAAGVESTFDGVSFMQGWSNRLAPISAAAPSAANPLLAGQDAYADYIARLSARGDASALPEPGQPYEPQILTEMRDFAKQWQGIEAGGAPAAPTGAAAAPAVPLAALTDEQIEQLRTSLPEIASLAGDNTSQFAEHVRRAEQALREGRFFEAESWFDVALYYSPGHPLASAGRVHSQIGAGKYRSAALGVRRLFEAHPELINSRYAAGLLPDAQRLRLAAEELAEMLDAAGGTIEAGLLLAYLGHLTQQRDLIERGLADLAREQAQGELAEVLRRVWLPSEEP